TGKAHIAYKPVDRVVGLSKLARLVDVYARRLQNQERMTSQIATAIEEILNPRGVAAMIQAEHMCMSLRGVEKPGSSTITTQFTGSFRDNADDQVRFITMVRAAIVERPRRWPKAWPRRAASILAKARYNTFRVLPGALRLSVRTAKRDFRARCSCLISFHLSPSAGRPRRSRRVAPSHRSLMPMGSSPAWSPMRDRATC